MKRSISLALALLSSVSLCHAQGQPAKDAPERIQKQIGVDVVDKDLREVMEEIGREVGRNILVAPGVKEQVTIKLRDIPWLDAVRIIAKLTRCEVEEAAENVLLLTQPVKVTIQVNDANLRTVLQLLAAYSGKNIIIAPEVTGRVACDLKDLRWDKALRSIVKTAGPYVVVEDGPDLLRVVTRKSLLAGRLPKPLKLTALLVDPKGRRSSCVINGQVYRLGETVAEGWSVKEIRSYEVVLKGKDGEAVIELESAGR